jgi:hypothetical protein
MVKLITRDLPQNILCPPVRVKLQITQEADYRREKKG